MYNNDLICKYFLLATCFSSLPRSPEVGPDHSSSFKGTFHPSRRAMSRGAACLSGLNVQTHWTWTSGGGARTTDPMIEGRLCSMPLSHLSHPVVQRDIVTVWKGRWSSQVMCKHLRIPLSVIGNFHPIFAHHLGRNTLFLCSNKNKKT